MAMMMMSQASDKDKWQEEREERWQKFCVQMKMQHQQMQQQQNMMAMIMMAMMGCSTSSVPNGQNMMYEQQECIDRGGDRNNNN